MKNDLTIQLNFLSTGVEKINEATSAVQRLDSATRSTASGGGLDRLGKTLQSTGSRLNVLGQRMTWMVTVPLVAFGNKAIETALDVEKAWVSFRKVFSGTEEDFIKVQVAAKELSDKFGRPIEDIIQVVTEFNKAGIEGADNLSNLGRIASETAVTFDMELADSLEGVKSVMMGYGLSVQDAEQAMADINIIADKTTASEKGVLEVFNRAAGTARQAGFSIRELAASQSVFEKSAIPAGRAGNAMKSILVSLTKQSNIAKDQFLELGINMSGASWRTADASAKLEILAKKFLEVKASGDKLKLADLNEAMASLVGKFQVNNLNVLLEDMAANFDDNADSVSQFYDGLNVAANATENMAWKQQQLDKVMGSSPQKMAQLEQQYRNQMVIIGEKLLPLKVKLMETLIKLLDSFNNLSPGAQDFIIKLGLIAAAAGPVLSFVGLFTSGLGFLMNALSFIGGVLGTVTGAATSTGAAAGTTATAVGGLAAAIGPLVLGAAVVATAALIVGAIIEYKNLQTTLEGCAKAAQENKDKHDALQQKLNTMDTGPLRDQLQKANNEHQVAIDKVNEINKRYSGLPGVFKAVWDQVKTWLGQVVKQASQMWEEFKTYIFNLFASIGEWLITKWEEIKQTFFGAIDAISNWIKGFIEYMKGQFWYDLGFVIGAIIGLFIAMPFLIWEGIKKLYDYVKTAFSNAWNYLKENVPIWIDNTVNWFSALPGRVWNGLSSLASKIGKAFSDAWAYLKENVPKWIDETIKWFKELPGKIADALSNLGLAMVKKFGEAFDAVKKAIKNFIEGLSSGMKWALEQTGLKFSGGGIVPMVYAANGYLAKGRDTVPAMLSPGEMVLNRNQQNRLFDMLTGKTQLQASGGAVVNINVGTMVASRGEQREFARRIKELLNEDSNRY